MRKRDLHFTIILGSVVSVNILSLASLVIYYYRSTLAMNSRYYELLSKSDLCASYCSNVVEYITLLDITSSKDVGVSNSQNDGDQSEYDVVGTYGYGQTKSRDHVWIYRDDRLRNGQSRRVYLRKYPVNDPRGTPSS